MQLDEMSDRLIQSHNGFPITVDDREMRIQGSDSKDPLLKTQ